MTVELSSFSGTADVVVVGGGIIGLSVAYELLRARDPNFGRVLVVERGRCGQGCTQAAGGMIAPLSEAEVQSRAVVELGLDSLHRYPQFISSIEEIGGEPCGYRRKGTLWAAADADEMRELEHIRTLQREKGVESRLLSAAQVLEKEPHLSSRLAGGLEVDLDHNVDPRRLARALVSAIRKLGGTVLEHHPATGVEESDDRWRIRGTSPEGAAWSLSSRNIVLAAGPWAELELAAPIPRLGLRPVKGQALRLDQGRSPLLQHVIRSPRVYLVPGEDGILYVGATMEEQGYDASNTAGAVMDLLRNAWRLLPGVYDLPVDELVVGFRPALRDNQPVIGAAPGSGRPGLFLALGHYRDGVLLAPATGHYLAELIRSQKAPKALEPFAAGRFA